MKEIADIELADVELADVELADVELANLAGAGDANAFRLLLERHYSTIFRIALRLCGIREDAEDLAQDICSQLALKLRHFRGQSKFTTWLYQIILNAFRDQYRKQRTQTRYLNAFGEYSELQRDSDKAQAQQNEWLYQTLNELGNDLRETAILVVAEGMSHAQAAEILGIKEATVSWRIHELKKQLKMIAKLEGAIS